MIYPTYEKYKDSGVPWLGQVPVGWTITRLNEAAKIKTSNVDKKTEEGEEPVRLCNYVDIYYNEKITSKIEFMMASATFAEINKFRLYKGDVVLTKDSESPSDIGIPAFIDEEIEDLVCGYHLAVLKSIADKTWGAYLYYAIKSRPSAAQFEVLANGITRFGLSQDDLKSILFALPPLPEQKTIADFLDVKTAEIDALIAKKQELLKLLAEQRTALITTAVTKGLNPNTPMKDSGIDWLGQVPEGWAVKRLKDIVTYNDESLPETTEPDMSIKYVDISSVNLIDGITNVEEFEFEKAPSRARRIVRHGDTIVSTVRTYLKAIAAIRNPEDNLIVSTGFAVVRPRNKVDPEYLGYFLQSQGFIGEVVSKSVGVSYPAINASDLVGIESLLPPLLEQKTIADFLDVKTAEIDALRKKVMEAIDRLKECRTALITNAVTGKIKVV